MLTKVSFYPSESDFGYAAIPLFGPADAAFEKVASGSLLPEVVKYVDALRPQQGSQYVLGSAMGAGEYFGCFPAGTLVQTSAGELPIESVLPGTLVVTHKNRLRSVRALLPKKADELCDLYVQGLPANVPALTATPNHELFVVPRKLFKLEKGRKVFYADTSVDLQTRRLNLMRALSFEWRAIASLEKGDLVAEPFPLAENPEILGSSAWADHAVAYIMGVYAADGCSAKNYNREDARPEKLVLTIGAPKTTVVARVIQAAAELGYTASARTIEEEHVTRVEISSRALTELCLAHIGTPAPHKFVSAQLLHMPRAWQRVFFDAYSSCDGCLKNAGSVKETLCCSSASTRLLHGLRLLLARLGVVAAIDGRHNKKATWYAGRPIYALQISGGQLKGGGQPKSYIHPDGYLLSAVKRTRVYAAEADVYDLSVEEDTSYVASGIAVHNSNSNGDFFEESGLIHKPDSWTGDPLLDTSKGKSWTYGFPTFYAAHAFAHHRNKHADRAYGDVEFAAWNDHMKRVELVIRVDRDKCEKFGGTSVWDKLQAGKYPDLSMGSRVCYDLDSIHTDWGTYNKALATFDPKRHAYPGLAVVEYHRKLIAETGKGIRGLSITRKDYAPHQLKDMNRILPDGRKVFVYNPYPRFFDISFVFIGADRTAKVMVYVRRPSAEAGELIYAKTASVLVDLGQEKTAEVLWHGSPSKIEVLEPRQAHGDNAFQNQKAVYAAEQPLMAKVYAIGKTLKGRADFAITGDNHLVIVGSAKPSAGWLYKLDEDDAVHGTGKANAGQAYIKSEVEPAVTRKIDPSEIESRIIRVKDKAELAEVVAAHKAQKTAGDKTARISKKSEIEKSVVPQWSVGSAVPLLTKSERDLPDDILKMLASHDLPKSLSTLGGMGMVLRPREFQKIVLVRAGKQDLADELDQRGILFPKSRDSIDCPLSSGLFSAGLASLLAPFFAGRTALSPMIEDRLVMHVAGPTSSRDSSVSARDLSTMGAHYNGYRKKLMDIVTAAQDLLQEMGAKEENLKKVASASVESVFTPLTVAYLTGAFMDEVPA